ncbi:MAG: glycoside hydrolase [Chloroflexi bacterium]|nr:glycoside hydrolase [Chloroflexota bacterium]MCL5273654.1 glycoside hydrolase [Chloroflexota bacterium]
MSKQLRILSVVVSFSMVLASALITQAASGGSHKWKLDPTINAPWALESDQQPLDSPTAAGLCRSNPFNTTGAYGSLGSNVDAIVGDAVNLSGFSNLDCTTPQNETTIAANPTNPKNLIAGANDYRVCCDFDGLNDGTGWAYYSFDGGATWGNVQLPGLTAETGGTGAFQKLDAAGDPVVTFSPDGVAYYANIVFSRVSFASGVVVSVSRDGGKTWSAPSMVAFVNAGNFFNDKEWIAAGANGQVVVTWTRFSLGPLGSGYLASPIVAAVSKDYGKTWNSQGLPVSDAAHPYNQGSQPQYGPDGALYVAYEGASPATGYATDAMVLARSTDDGRTFQTKELARVYDDLDCYPIYGGRQTLTDMHFRLNSYPSMSVDPVTGQIAIVWADNQGSGTCGGGGSSFTGTTSNQVKLLKGSWATIGSASVALVTSSAEDKVFPAVASYNGKTVVSYYTRDYAINSKAAVCNLMTNSDPGAIDPQPTTRSVCLDYAAKSSANNYRTQKRLSTQSSNPFIQFADGAFIGDYSQVALGSDGNAHAAWTDFRGNPGITPANQDVMVQTFQ